MRLGHSSSGKAATGLLVATATACGLAASLGAGYTAARSTLSDSSAYAAKGNAVVHVNGPARRVDATSKGTLARSGQDVDTVALPDGKVAAINRSTNTVTVLDGATMSPTATVQTGKKAASAQPVRVVSSSSNGWLIDPNGRVVRRLVDGKPQRGVSVDDTPVDAAPGPHGSVLVLTQRGEVVEVDPDASRHRIDVEAAPGGALTVAGSHTYLVTLTGDVVQVDSAEPTKVTKINGASAGPTGRMLVGSALGAGPHVLVVIRGGVVVVDPDAGSKFVIQHRAGSDTLGQPVEYHDHVYVPDFSKHTVLVLDERTGQAGKPLAVPGNRPTFALFVSGGRLWMNDQYAQHLLELDGSGVHRVDKGTGNGTHDDSQAPKTAKHPTPAAPHSGGVAGTGGSGGTGGTAGSAGSGGRDTSPRSGAGGPPSPPPPPPQQPPQQPKYVRLPRFPAHTVYEDACQQIEALGPHCVAVSNDQDGVTDEVIRTVPDEGTKVPADSTVTVVYVGPDVVPTLDDGTTPANACTTLQVAGLRCHLVPASGPAPDPTRYGTVADTKPAAGSKVDKQSTVDVYYYDAFAVPNYVGTKGTAACAALQQYTLQLQPPAKPVGIQCVAQPGSQHVAKNDPGQADVVYAQNVPRGATYRPGAQTPPLQLTVYNSQARLRSYQSWSAQDAVADCSTVFDCQLAPQAVSPVDGNGPHPDWVGKVAGVQDANGNNLPPGNYPVGSQTAVRIVEYGNVSTVPNVQGQEPGTACNAIKSAGFTCVSQTVFARQANVVLAQSPTQSQQPLGTPVTITYANLQPLPLNEYVSTDMFGDVNILRVQGQPVPPGYTFKRTVALAYTPGSVNADWHLKEFHNANCKGVRGDNVLYSHGAPDGCMHDDFRGNAADVLYPTSICQPDDGTCDPTCQPGTVWLWRVSTDVTVQDKDGKQRSSTNYDVQLGGPQRGTNPHGPHLPPPAPGSGYDEALGCVFPPS